MVSQSEQIQDPAAALLTLRILWAAMLGGVVTFGVVVAFLFTKGGYRGTSSSPDLERIFLAIGFGALVIAVPIGYFIRNQSYKRHWQGQAVTPGGYVTGNLILLAMCEGVAFFSLVATLAVGAFGWVTAPGVLAAAGMLVNFPTGRPMMSTTNRYEAPPPR